MAIILIPIILGLLMFLVSKYIYKKDINLYVPQNLWLYVLAGIVYYIFVVTPVLAIFNYSDRIAAYIYAASNLASIIFFIININRRPFFFFLLGGLLNFIAIALNFGFMPVSPQHGWFIQGAKNIFDGGRIPYTHTIILSHPNVWFLTDIFYLKIPYYYSVVFSLGDIFLFVGLFDYFSGNLKTSMEDKNY